VGGASQLPEEYAHGAELRLRRSGVRQQNRVPDGTHMRIGIDVQTLQTYERTRGIGRLCVDTINLLADAGPASEIVLFGFGSQPGPHIAALLRENVSYEPIELAGGREEHLRMGCAAPFLWQTKAASKLDLYHVTSPMMADVLLPAGGPCAIVATFLDAIPAIMDARGTPILTGAAARHYSARGRILGTYHRLLAISTSAAEDCRRYFGIPGDRIDVTYVPVRQTPLPASAHTNGSADILTRLGLGSGYVISITGFHPRKNIQGTLAAHARLDEKLRRNHPLVLVCSLENQERAQIEDQARRLGILRELVITGYVSDADLSILLTHAAVMLFPSHYEGFGLPAADAMAHGVPVVASNLSSLPEVVGDAGILCDPDDPAELAGAVESLLRDAALRSRLATNAFPQVARFSPQEYLERVLRGYSKAWRERFTVDVTAHATSALRVASFGGGTGSVVSAYAGRLLMHLPPEVSVDCYVDSSLRANPDVARRFACHDYSAFVPAHKAKPYQAILYHFADEAAHAPAMAFAERFPGVSVFHEATLLGLHRTLARDFGLRHAAQVRFADQYRTEDASVWEHDRLLHQINPLEATMTRGVASRSRAIVVHSNWMKRFIESHHTVHGPVRVIPHGASAASVSREERAGLRRRHGIGRDVFVVTLAGPIDSRSGVVQVLEAFTRFRQQAPATTLLLGGSADPATLGEVNRYCSSAGLKHAVQYLGARSYDEMMEIAAVTDIGIDFRYPTRGKVAPMLPLMLAAGKPALVAAADEFLEYPDDVCWKVDIGAAAPSQMLEYLHHLHGNPDHAAALGTRASEFVSGNDWTATAHRYVELLAWAANIRPLTSPTR
jgi:glycosyltransferase involved in cell wall biosynthesis